MLLSIFLFRMFDNTYPARSLDLALQSQGNADSRWWSTIGSIAFRAMFQLILPLTLVAKELKILGLRTPCIYALTSSIPGLLENLTASQNFYAIFIKSVSHVHVRSRLHSNAKLNTRTPPTQGRLYTLQSSKTNFKARLFTVGVALTFQSPYEVASV